MFVLWERHCYILNCASYSFIYSLYSGAVPKLLAVPNMLGDA